jgi:glutathione S-transferase
MKLYFAPGACSLAPHIIACETGLTLDLHKVEFGPAGATADGDDFAVVNPKSAVPALILGDGQVLTENAVVLQYLAAQAPDAGLGPPPFGMERWRFLELLNFIATELHKGFLPLFHQEFGPQGREAAIKLLTRRFELLSGYLADRSFLMGDRFTLLDAYAYVTLTWTRMHKIDLGRWPSLVSYMERIESRPAVQKARQEEGLDGGAPQTGEQPAGDQQAMQAARGASAAG